MCYESAAIRNGCKKYEFVYHLASLFMRDPITEEEEKLDQEDKYYPFLYPNDRSHSAPRKILRGEIPVPVEAASKIRECFDASEFLDVIEEMSKNWEAFELFKKSFEKVGIVFEQDEDVGERLVKEFSDIIRDIVEGQSNTSSSTSPVMGGMGQRRLEDISPSGIYLDKQKHKIVVNGESIQVTPLIYNEEIQPEEQKYIAALLEAYADKKGVDSINLEELKGFDFFYDDLNTQRRYFFDAESVYRAIRDAFVDGDEEFSKLKDEAYEGIREVYISDHPDGFARLLEVLKKITSTQFDRTKLTTLTGLIGNSEKKGVCHMLVEDGKIQTWVIKY